MTASRNAQPLPIDADPWLWWQQLRSDLLAGSTIKGHQSPERIAVLAERRGDQWPLEFELCEYYRDSIIGTGTVANCRDTITRVRRATRAHEDIPPGQGAVVRCAASDQCRRRDRAQTGTAFRQRGGSRFRR